MTLLLEEIAPWSGTRPQDRPVVERKAQVPSSRFSRRRFIKTATGVAVGVGVASLGVFPLARPAFADGYDIWTSTTTGPCGSGGYASGHGCSPGCGPSTVCTAKTCCNCSGTRKGFHRTDGNVAVAYTLRPNECWSGGYDGWRWKCDSTRTWRCHDGWTCSSSACFKSICRWDVNGGDSC